MLGGNHIRTGAFVALLSTALFGCTVPVPFIHSTPHGTSETITPPAPVVEQSAPPALHAIAAPDALVEGPDLWRKLGEGFTLHALPQHRVTNPMARLRYGKSVIEKASSQSEPYLHFIVQELEARKLPYELALIPLIESAYNPAAGSRNGPTGLWQLIPSTGQRFGLQQSSWYDGRRDVVASTRAALHYFEQLRDEFAGDWLLAIAAYNCGERTIAQAVERNRQRGRSADFWSVGVPGGARGYVERLLAVSAVLSDPSAYGVTPATVRDRPYFDIADVGPNLPLSQVAAASGLAADDFRAMNPAFLQQTTVAGATQVLVAHGHGDDVSLALSAVSDELRRLPKLPVATTVGDASTADGARRDHTVRAGESLSVIAARAGVSVRALRDLNGSSSNQLRLGQVLRLPDSGKRVASANSSAKAAPSMATHVVTSGDNLWDIARHYHVSPEALAQANGITPRTVLKLGQKLRLPTVTANRAVPDNLNLAANDAEEQHYQVRAGDSLWTISRRFNVSVDALMKWNRLPAAAGALQPGQRLVVNGET